MAREAKKERITKKRESQILEAALSVFSEKGYGVATIPDIAEKAGLAVGSIYNYYPSKRELFLAVIKNFILNAPLLNLIDELPNGDIASTFSKIMHNRLSLIENTDISKMSFLMAEIQRDPELKSLWSEEFLQPFFKKMETIYENLTKTGKYTISKPEITVRIIGGMILGFLMLRMMEGENSPLTTTTSEDITDNLVKFLLFGLSGKQSGDNDGRTENER
ncbi:MAG: TetR/AcrR family transcriptional regulator [Dehalococcoidales bacterium]|nr:TetR/AcrR family transcriptional regulator [Dehalococcoidales bacterium]